MFEWDWWRILGDVPRCSRLVRYWDLAGTEVAGRQHDPDYTAGTLAGIMDDGRTVFLHQAAFRKGVAARDARLEAIARQDRERYGQAVAWWFERETGIAGKDRMEAIVRRIQGVGLPVHHEPATGSKEVRAEPLASAAEAGNVTLAPDDPIEPWHDAFREETVEFPNGGIHDDRVDSAAGAYNKVTLHEPGSVRFTTIGI